MLRYIVVGKKLKLKRAIVCDVCNWEINLGHHSYDVSANVSPFAKVSDAGEG